MKKVRNILLVALLVLSVVSIGSVAGTYAKYTSTKTITDTARVAKWDIKLGEKQLWDATATFNIFNYVDSGVKSTDGRVDGLIAPGTKGELDIAQITNASEVAAEYSISFTAETNGIPIEFSTDNGSTWTTDLSTLTLSGTLAPGAAANAIPTLQWRWAFERGTDDITKATNNGTDTDLGKAGTAEVTVTATITATQLDEMA